MRQRVQNCMFSFSMYHCLQVYVVSVYSYMDELFWQHIAVQTHWWFIVYFSSDWFSEYDLLQFVGNVHGDEPVGREILLLLANWLCENYKKDPLVIFRVLWLCKNTSFVDYYISYLYLQNVMHSFSLNFLVNLSY